MALLEKYGVRGLTDRLAQVMRERAASGGAFPYDPINFRDSDPVEGNDLRRAAGIIGGDFWD